MGKKDRQNAAENTPEQEKNRTPEADTGEMAPAMSVPARRMAPLRPRRLWRTISPPGP